MSIKEGGASFSRSRTSLVGANVGKTSEVTAL